MEESILNTVKDLLGIDSADTDFDNEIITNINSAFSMLTQLGAGPKDGFFITDETNLWSEYTDQSVLLHLVKLYVYLTVKMIFDPPVSSGVMQAMDNQLKQIEFRIVVEVEPYELSKPNDI